MITKSKNKAYFVVEFDLEDDGRWIAEIPKLPGVMAYGLTKKEALQKVYAIALRTLADSIEQGRTFTPVARLFDHEVARRRKFTEGGNQVLNFMRIFFKDDFFETQ